MRLLFTLLLMLMVNTGFADSGPDPESAIRLVALDQYRASFADNSSASIESEPAQKLTPERPTPPAAQNVITLAEVVRRVVKQNQQLLGVKTEIQISQAEVENNRSIFEPELLSSLSLSENSQRNTIEESLSQQLASTYSERNWDFNTSVQGLIKTGGQVSLDYNLRKLSNSLTRSLTDEDNEYQMYLGVNLTQPLLKNFGVETTTAAIRTAMAETRVSQQNYRQEMMRLVGKTALNYWDFYHAQQKMLLRADSIRIASQVLHDNQERLRTGKMGEDEVYEAMIAVTTRNSLLSEARQELLTAANKIRTLLAVAVSSETVESIAVDEPQKQLTEVNQSRLLAEAFQLHPRYLAAKEKLKQAEIQIAFAENQRWPELDLIASYGLNGLDFSSSGSWRQLKDTEYDAWSVGMQYRQPLQGGLSGRSELKKAELEKKKELYALKDIEIELVNDIDTAINQLLSLADQFKNAEEIVKIQKQLLETETAQMLAGQSDSRTLLEKEDSYRVAREKALESLINLQTARTDLDLTSGGILRRYGVDVMETKL